MSENATRTSNDVMYLRKFLEDKLQEIQDEQERQAAILENLGLLVVLMQEKNDRGAAEIAERLRSAL